MKLLPLILLISIAWGQGYTITPPYNEHRLYIRGGDSSDGFKGTIGSVLIDTTNHSWLDTALLKQKYEQYRQWCWVKDTITVHDDFGGLEVHHGRFRNMLAGTWYRCEFHWYVKHPHEPTLKEFIWWLGRKEK